MLPADLDGPTMPPANAPAPLIEVDDDEWDPAHFPQDRLDVWNATVDWSGSGTINVSHEGPLPTAPFDGNLCGFAACIPQPGTSTEARHAQRPAHVPDGVPELRRPPGDRRQPLGRRRRRRPCRRPLVRAPQDVGQLVDLPAGHLRAGHDGEPLDGLCGDGPRREHGHRLLDEQRYRAELSEHPLRRAPRHRSAEPALSGRDDAAWPGQARRPTRSVAGATTR